MKSAALAAAIGVLVARGAFCQSVTDFPTPTVDSGPIDITNGPDGNLWFTESDANRIGRITPAGVITEFPTPSGPPIGIAAGPDGALWFTEPFGDQIGRITTAGVITEFPITTTGAVAWGITAGPDGNLWFAESSAGQIGRITTAGVVTEFPVLTATGGPHFITSGPDGALWFTEYNGDRIGRITTAGVVTEFTVPTAGGAPNGITTGSDGALWFTEDFGGRVGRITTAGTVTEVPPFPGTRLGLITSGADGALWFTKQTFPGQISRITTGGAVTDYSINMPAAGPYGIAARPDGSLWFTESHNIGRLQLAAGLAAEGLAVDSASASGTVSNANGILEPGETVLLTPTWRNVTTFSLTPTGSGSNATGPAGALYGLADASATYGAIGAGSTGNCGSDCYEFSLSSPAPRPAAHWDASFDETLSNGTVHTWTLHVGDSFSDVAMASPFYRFIETIFHNGVTAGCGGTNYCPGSSTTRQQMAVFGLVSKEGSSYSPPVCGTPMFGDVPASSPFCRWVEELARRGVVAGCGGGNYCPTAAVSRQQMAVFALATLEGSAYSPPACATPVFNDLPASSPFCRWVEELARRGVVAGCGGGAYCPADPVTRAQMGVFLTATFGLKLYGP